MRSRQFAAGISLLISLTSFVQLAPNLLPSKAFAQMGDYDPPPRAPVGNRAVLRDDERNSPTQLPWLIISKNRNEVVPLPVSNKISTFFLSRGLSPVSCSTQPVVIMTVNNIYVACASPTSNFPPGNYNATIPDL